MKGLLIKVLLLAALFVVLPLPAQAVGRCSTNMMDYATPICVKSELKRLVVYSIGDKSDEYPEGISKPTRYAHVDVLAKKYPTGSGNIVLYNGTNPITDAPLIISYLADDKLIHFDTYTWDRYYKRWKPYVFVVDRNDKVNIWVWGWTQDVFDAFRKSR